MSFAVIRVSTPTLGHGYSKAVVEGLCDSPEGFYLDTDGDNWYVFETEIDAKDALNEFLGDSDLENFVIAPVADHPHSPSVVEEIAHLSKEVDKLNR